MTTLDRKLSLQNLLEMSRQMLQGMDRSFLRAALGGLEPVRVHMFQSWFLK